MMPTSPCPVLLETPPTAERRAWTRVSTCFEAFYQFKNRANEEALGSGQVVNISRGGLRILCKERMEPGTAFRIGIADGEDGLFTLLMARVVYLAPAPAHKWFVGCHFTPKLREEILQWMQRIGGEE
jgi:c-di-GMP-binding flagellar brake protein YcgR